MSVSLKMVAEGWLEKQRELEAIEEARDEYGDVLSHRAHTILKDRHKLSRTGMYPRVRDIKDGGEVWFEVSNGIDYGDDFGVMFTLDELERLGGDRLFSPSQLRRES